MWLYEYKTIMCGSQRNSCSGYVFSSLHDLAWLSDHMVKQLYGWEPLILSHHLPKSDGHRQCDSEDTSIFFPVNIRLGEDALKTCWRRLQRNIFCLPRRLQGVSTLKTPWRRIWKISWNTSWRRQDVLEDEQLWCLRRFQQFLLGYIIYQDRSKSHVTLQVPHNSWLCQLWLS